MSENQWTLAYISSKVVSEKWKRFDVSPLLQHLPFSSLLDLKETVTKVKINKVKINKVKINKVIIQVYAKVQFLIAKMQARKQFEIRMPIFTVLMCTIDNFLTLTALRTHLPFMNSKKIILIRNA